LEIQETEYVSLDKNENDDYACLFYCWKTFQCNWTEKDVIEWNWFQRKFEPSQQKFKHTERWVGERRKSDFVWFNFREISAAYFPTSWDSFDCIS